MQCDSDDMNRVTTPTAEHLFLVNEKPVWLDQKIANMFYHNVVKLLATTSQHHCKEPSFRNFIMNPKDDPRTTVGWDDRGDWPCECPVAPTA